MGLLGAISGYRLRAEVKKQQLIIDDFLKKVQETLDLEKGKMISFYKRTLEIRGIKVGKVKEPLPQLGPSEENAAIHLVEEFLDR